MSVRTCVCMAARCSLLQVLSVLSREGSHCTGSPSLPFLDVMTRYGYITNTKVKFIVIVENTNSLSKDSEIKQVSVVLQCYW